VQPILVVEDDPQLRQMLRATLEDEGWPVETAADGRRALDWLIQRRPALLVLDWGLSDFSGDVVSTALRTLQGAGVRILLITGSGQAAEKAGQIGAFSYLNKPFELDDFITVVRRGLDSNQTVA
jgi:DNA-binding response OmpR family regulator